MALMSSPDPDVTIESYDAMDASIDLILRGAGFTKNQYLRFSMYDTIQEPTKEDMSDEIVSHPLFTSLFARGKVVFVSSNYDDDEIKSPVYTDPTWTDVIIEGERSCRMRGAPELDHLFLECVEPDGVEDGVTRYAMHFGS